MADRAYPCFLLGPVKVEQTHAAGDDYISWTFTEEIYGLQLSDEVAIAPDGTRFDPRTLHREAVPDG